MWHKFIISTAIFAVLVQDGMAIMCHRCFSAMGGCGDHVNLWMFPWRDCGDSKFCVKVAIKDGSETKYIRECENNLMKSAYHRLRMPILRRHGYCRPARKNDFWNPLQNEDNDVMYCFCNEWNGCNSAPRQVNSILSIIFSAALMAFISKRFL